MGIRIMGGRVSDVDLFAGFGHLCTALVVHYLDVPNLYVINCDAAQVFGFAVLLDYGCCFFDFRFVRLLRP